MKNNLYLRSTFRDIRSSLGRFIAIILIIFMAVLLFVGIKSVGPDLETSIQNYVVKNNVSDLQIVSTAGLTENDLKAVETISGVEAELGYSFPYADETHDRALQLYSYDKKAIQNKLKLIKGRFPTKSTEIVLDTALEKEYPLGSQMIIDSDRLMKNDFKVVGYVESPIYVNKEEKGATSIGNGTIDGYAYINEVAFNHDAYSILYLRFDDLLNENIFSKKYSTTLMKRKEQVEKIVETRKAERKQELVDQATVEINKNQTELIQNQKKLDEGQQQLDFAKQQLEQEKNQLTTQKEQLIQMYGETAASNFADGEVQIEQAEKNFEEQQELLSKNQTKILEGQLKINEAKTEVADLNTPNYFITEREANPGFEEVTSLSTRIDAIGNIFPVFFFLIGALITFTTITRMVEEDRKVIGSLKALGYRNSEISQKYLVYALLTVSIGSVLGVIVGTKLLPPIVFKMLSSSYVFTAYLTNFWIGPILIAIGGALIATVVATIYILIKDLREKPMALLMPKAPKPGKRILLEYITPLWTRLSFNQKVTYRNLFRYKARMILTISGIAGCCGLMVAGFGLRDSIGGAADVQFNQLNHFQAIVIVDNNATVNDTETVDTVLKNEQEITSNYPVYTTQVKFKQDGLTDQAATIYSFSDNNQVNKYFTLKKANNDSLIELGDNGAIITTGLAKAYNVKVGDELTMQNADGTKLRIKVSGIVENYLGNNIFVNQRYLEKISGERIRPNSFLVKTNNMTVEAQNRLSKKLQETKQVRATTFMSQQIEKQTYASTNFQPVVLIFIVLSGTLALVVLFNLTNINVSERERELATIKVLGFFNMEVTMYIVRETIIFTVLGILLGFGVGKILTWFIITTAASPMISFPLLIPISGYLFSAGLTILFSLLVMFITHRRLKKIDMITALKSNE